MAQAAAVTSRHVCMAEADLRNDPHEMDNLFDDPGHRGVRGELMERLAYRQMELTDRSPLPMGRA